VLLVVIIVRSLSSSLFLGACVCERQKRNSETEKHIYLLQIEEVHVCIADDDDLIAFALF
jgi:hypothetical protein